MNKLKISEIRHKNTELLICNKANECKSICFHKDEHEYDVGCDNECLNNCLAECVEVNLVLA